MGDIRPISNDETVFIIILATLGAILSARTTATFASIFHKMDANRTGM